jgi:hypothetical protein
MILAALMPMLMFSALVAGLTYLVCDTDATASLRVSVPILKNRIYAAMIIGTIWSILMEGASGNPQVLIISVGLSALVGAGLNKYLENKKDV